jgi:hypothetical protein
MTNYIPVEKAHDSRRLGALPAMLSENDARFVAVFYIIYVFLLDTPILSIFLNIVTMVASRSVLSFITM